MPVFAIEMFKNMLIFFIEALFLITSDYLWNLNDDVNKFASIVEYLLSLRLPSRPSLMYSYIYRVL